MASTYELIASQTLGSAASSVTFSSIPQTYDDLAILIATRVDYSTIAGVNLRFNGVTTGYSSKNLRSSGSSVLSQSLSKAEVGFAPGTSQTADTFTNIEAYLPNYAGSDNKSFTATGAQENNATTAYIHVTAGLWSSTAAVTQVDVTAGAGNFVANSSFYLYGVKHA